MNPLSGFTDPVVFEHADVRLPIYTSIDGEKPIIVLHELPGMSPSFVSCCRRLAGEGFKVYMPLLFGSADSQMGSFQMARFCLSREFRQLFSVGDKRADVRPFTAWLAELARHVIDNNSGRQVGVIGMCLTGGFGLVAFAVPGVAAVICCQPAYPFFFNIKSLGLSESQRQAAVDGAQLLPSPCAKGYRYEKDRICRSSHIAAIEHAFDQSFVRHPELPGRGHSTLTGETADEDVFQDVVAFLKQRL